MNITQLSDPLNISVEDGSAPLMDIKQVTKVLQKGDNVFQLDIPDMSIYSGEFVAIVGESGCGKSTLLDLLALISAPTKANEFRLNFSIKHYFDIAKLWQSNDDSLLASIRQHYLGYILQTGGLLPYLSVEKNLILPINIKKNNTTHRDVWEMARRMGVADCLSRLPSALSGGQRQRAAILRALLHQPSLVLADEPTAAVDRQRAIAIVEDFYRLAKDKKLAILMVTHDIDLVENIADKAYSFHVSTRNYKTQSTIYQWK